MQLVGMFEVEATLWEVEDPTILNGTNENGEVDATTVLWVVSC